MTLFDSIESIRAASNRFATPLPPALPHGCRSVLWLYAPGEYEAALVERVVDEGRAAGRFVHFVENFQRPQRVIRLQWTGFAPARFRAHGHVRAVGEDVDLRRFEEDWWEVHPGSSSVVEVTASDHACPTIGVDPSDASSWQVAVDADTWSVPKARPGGSMPAHLAGEPRHDVEYRPIGDGVWELPTHALGRPVISSDTRPAVVGGESLAELDSTAPSETVFDTVQRPDGVWTTVNEICGRYLRIAEAAPSSVHFEARLRPLANAGAFVCSDDRLTSIWHASALTLHLCMQGLVVDGLKRDRMPWAGDQALSTITNAFTSGEGSIIRDGIIALGRPTHGYVNGIADYSLWWVVNLRHYVEYFGDTGLAVELAEHVDSFVSDLAEHRDPDGVFEPPRQPDGFGIPGGPSIFIDWGFTLPDAGPSGALQILWFWAVDCAVEVLRLASHPAAARWADVRTRTRDLLRTRAWDATTATWRDAMVDADADHSPYANFLAVLSGLDAAPSRAALDAVEHGPMGTPFMRAMALSVLARHGRGPSALEEIRQRWGEMLDVGPGTMWEDFVGPEPYAMYRRPFAKSLCHAWGSGPAAVLSEAVFGLQPTSPGWETFVVQPDLAGLDWAAAVVPSPAGDIGVTLTMTQLVVWVPEGARLFHDGEQIVGPARYESQLSRASEAR